MIISVQDVILSIGFQLPTNPSVFSSVYQPESPENSFSYGPFPPLASCWGPIGPRGGKLEAGEACLSTLSRASSSSSGLLRPLTLGNSDCIGTGQLFQQHWWDLTPTTRLAAASLLPFALPAPNTFITSSLHSLALYLKCFKWLPKETHKST